jgi:hypothetical protein
MEYITSYMCPQIPSNVNFDILHMPPKFKWSVSSFIWYPWLMQVWSYNPFESLMHCAYWMNISLHKWKKIVLYMQLYMHDEVHD